MDEKIKKIRKECLQALDKREAIRWGLATSLHYEATIEYICELFIRIKELEEGIERYLNDPEFDTDILTKLIEKENKNG